MTTTKRIGIIYWSATVIVFLLEGVVPALTSHTELAVQGVRHLGYPDYFRVMLTVFKVLGALALILPFVHNRVKEWAYAGFAFTMVSAFVSHWAVDGPGGQTFFPLFILAILATSFIAHEKMGTTHKRAKATFKTGDYAISGLPQ